MGYSLDRGCAWEAPPARQLREKWKDVCFGGDSPRLFYVRSVVAIFSEHILYVKLLLIKLLKTQREQCHFWYLAWNGENEIIVLCCVF